MFRVIVVVFVKLPEVPVIVTVAGVGLNDPVTPLGRPDTDRATLPAKPSCGVIATVLVPPPPCVITRLVGHAESVKLGVGEVMETLSKVAVATAVLSLALTARPT